MLLLIKIKVDVRSTVLDIKEILSNEVFQILSLERLIGSFSLHAGNSHAHQHIKNY